MARIRPAARDETSAVPEDAEPAAKVIALASRRGPPAPGASAGAAPPPAGGASLLERVAAHDAAAARACIERYGGLVWSLARRACPGSAEAEDAVQDIFIDVWKSAGRYDPASGTETTFIATIARRRLIDWGRSERRRPREPISDDLVDPAAGGRPELAAEAALAARAVAQLRPEQRHVLLLATCEGLSHGEIARELEMPLGTVKAHVRRGLLHLKRALFGEAPAEGTGRRQGDLE